MFRTIRTGTAYANSVSTIALVLALMGGGTAMAAAELAKNSHDASFLSRRRPTSPLPVTAPRHRSKKDTP